MPNERPEQNGQERLSENALARRAKRWWREGPYETFVQCTPGLERVTAAELVSLGFATDDQLAFERGGVTLSLSPAEVMRANLSLRTASRVLLRVAPPFLASMPEMLYDHARRLPWEVHLGFQEEYSLHITSRGSKLQAGDEVAKAVRSAVSRHMRELDLYPRVVDDAPVGFHVRLQDDRCTISLNTSGENLHRRGQRQHVSAAPVRETVAAAMVYEALAGQDEPADVIVDPFCGSGTVLLEARDVLMGAQPGRARSFAFESAGWFREGQWREVRRQAENTSWLGEAPKGRSAPRLLGFDNDGSALNAARLNLSGGPKGGATPLRVELAEADSTRLDLDAFGARRGVIVTNLPYGVRLGGKRAALDVTRRFLGQVAAANAEWRVVLLCSAAEAEVAAEFLEVSSAAVTKNGGLDVVLLVGRG